MNPVSNPYKLRPTFTLTRKEGMVDMGKYSDNFGSDVLRRIKRLVL